jgi:hypothetical protein
VAVSPDDARRWLARFEAAAEADRGAKRAGGVRSIWSIQLALSLHESAMLAAARRLVDPGREQRDAGVRLIWQRLRSRLTP